MVVRFMGLVFFLMLGYGFAAQETQYATSTVLMVPPEGFQYNPETAKSNTYQHHLSISNLKAKVMSEFHQMVAKLRKNGIEVVVFKQDPYLVDAVFPNNWFSTHVDEKGETTLLLYPMLTQSRQKEVNPVQLRKTLKEHRIVMRQTIDLRNDQNQILEGTGSMILDREHHRIYAAISPRTDPVLVKKVGSLLGYQPILFHSVDALGKAIYHTNVMMGLAKQYAVLCLDCIPNKQERDKVVATLKQDKKQIIVINQDQVGHMCGNVLELKNNQGKNILVMSKQAYDHYTPEQLNLMRHFSKIVPVQLNLIEAIGGGSARCMLAEIYH